MAKPGSNWSNVSFEAVRQPDHALIKACLGALDDEGVSGDMIEIVPIVENTPIREPRNEWTSEQSEVRRNSSPTAVLTQYIKISTSAGFTIRIDRRTESHRDKVTIDLSRLTQTPHQLSREQVSSVIQELKTRLFEITSSVELDILGDSVRTAIETREAHLASLERTAASLIHGVAEASQRQEKNLNEQIARREADLNRRHIERTRELEAEFNKKMASADAREAEIDERAKHFDEQDARQARRRLRNELKEELTRRSMTFRLTDGTRGLRRPITLALWLLIAVSASSFYRYTISDTDTTANYIRQALSALALTSSLVFYVRWQNSWFNRHADEEFMLKRLDLDIDRASWVVEMALEWQEGGDREIPPNLLDRLTNNLFATDSVEEEPLHPADQLASALLGTSAEARLQLADGSMLRFDRKALNRLNREGAPD